MFPETNSSQRKPSLSLKTNPSKISPLHDNKEGELVKIKKIIDRAISGANKLMVILSVKNTQFQNVESGQLLERYIDALAQKIQRLSFMKTQLENYKTKNSHLSTHLDKYNEELDDIQLHIHKWARANVQSIRAVYLRIGLKIKTTRQQIENYKNNLNDGDSFRLSLDACLNNYFKQQSHQEIDGKDAVTLCYELITQHQKILGYHDDNSASKYLSLINQSHARHARFIALLNENLSALSPNTIERDLLRTVDENNVLIDSHYKMLQLVRTKTESLAYSWHTIGIDELTVDERIQKTLTFFLSEYMENKMLIKISQDKHLAPEKMIIQGSTLRSLHAKCKKKIDQAIQLKKIAFNNDLDAIKKTLLGFAFGNEGIGKLLTQVTKSKKFSNLNVDNYKENESLLTELDEAVSAHQKIEKKINQLVIESKQSSEYQSVTVLIDKLSKEYRRLLNKTKKSHPKDQRSQILNNAIIVLRHIREDFDTKVATFLINLALSKNSVSKSTVSKLASFLSVKKQTLKDHFLHSMNTHLLEPLNHDQLAAPKRNTITNIWNFFHRNTPTALRSHTYKYWIKHGNPARYHQLGIDINNKYLQCNSSGSYYVGGMSETPFCDVGDDFILDTTQEVILHSVYQSVIALGGEMEKHFFGYHALNPLLNPEGKLYVTYLPDRLGLP